MNFIINKKSNIKKQINSSYSWPTLFENDSLNIYYKIQTQIGNKIFKDNYSNFFDEININHSFVLYPGEYKIFKRKLYLPIYKEKNFNKEFIFNSLILNKNEIYDFSLGISANKKDIWNKLEDYQKKEIEDNNYEIFDGILISNKIPLVAKFK